MEFYIYWLTHTHTHTHIYFFFIIQQLKVRALPCTHQPPPRGDKVLVAQDATKLLLRPDTVSKRIIYIYIIYIYIYIYIR